MASIVHDGDPRPADRAAITAFAARFDQALPEDYLAFLREHNGGRPEPAEVLIEQVRDTVTVDAFFGLGDPDLDLAEIDDLNTERLIDGCFAFAKDPFGNQFILDLEEGGSVAYWDCNRDYEEFEGDGDDGDIFDVAHSFTAFLAMLRPEDSTVP